MTLGLPKYFTRKDLKLAGIYFLFNRRGRLIYIGQTGDLQTRLTAHTMYRKFTKIRFIPCSDKETRIKYEYRLIDYFGLK